jgi:structural maintenance of chromosome 2
VTLEGDVYDPAGTLTGGSRPQSTSVLRRLQELNDAREKLEEAEAGLSEVSDLILSLS